MRTTRRVVFAAPMVLVTGCGHPATRPAVIEAPLPPIQRAWNPPPEFLDALPPLGPTPPRAPRQALPRSRIWPIDGIARDGEGSRVRVRRVHEQLDERWEIYFVDGDDRPVRGGSCKIVGWDAQTVECRAEASPQELAPDGTLYPARVNPPEPSLHPDVASKRADHLARLGSKHEVDPCASVSPGIVCNPPPPRRLPRHEPPEATVAKVTQLAKVDAHYRVRVERLDDGMNASWDASFIDADGHAVPDGACKLVDWDRDHLECETSEWIALITPEVRLVPPPSQNRLARLVATHLVDRGIVLTFSRGAREGVEVGWRVEFLDEQDAPTGEACKIDAVVDRTASCTMSARPASNRVSLRR